MKAIILSVCIIALASCGKKEWSKEYMAKKCVKEFKGQKEIGDAFKGEDLTRLCDCVADKAISRYKSEKELEEDQSGAQEIGHDCAMEVLSK